MCVLVAGLVAFLGALGAGAGGGGGTTKLWVINTIWYWYCLLPWSSAVKGIDNLVVTPRNSSCVDQVSGYSCCCVEALLSQDLTCWIQTSPARFSSGSKDLECTPMGATNS